jgi:hypothetical protein
VFSRFPTYVDKPIFPALDGNDARHIPKSLQIYHLAKAGGHNINAYYYDRETTRRRHGDVGHFGTRLHTESEWRFGTYPLPKSAKRPAFKAIISAPLLLIIGE